MTTAVKTRRVRAEKPAPEQTTIEVEDRIFNLVPSTGTESDWSLRDILGSEPLGAMELPASVDLRQDWWTVGNQGSTGSCVGWATADGVGRYTMVEARRIAPSERLSPRYIWMGSKETDEFTSRPTTFVEEAGTSLKAAVEMASKYGFCLEADLPFSIATTMYVGKEGQFYASAAQRRIRYANLGKDPMAWKIWLADHGPILAGLSVDSNFARPGADGVISSFDARSVLGGHAICIVGYREDGTFIVRNSWGTTGWGDKGFGYITPEYLAAAFFPESYGATV